MLSSYIPNSAAVGSSTNKDESSQQIQLRLDGTDPYNIDNVEDLETEEWIDEECTIEEPIIEEHDYKTKPYIGMEFGDPEKAYNFYNRYASHVGFSVRRASQEKNKREVITSVRFTCSREGFNKFEKKKEMPIGSSINQKTPEKDRGISRMGCKASCRVRLVKDGIWQVTVFVEEHNHELIKNPSKKRYLRSHKCMTSDDKEIARNMRAQNMGSSQIHEYLAVQHGGKQFVRFRKKDVSNLIAADNRKLLGADVDTTVMYFQQKKDEDPEFFYAIAPDQNGVVMNIFWVDGRARRAYQEFEDVVTFDTTYQTNKYSMPLAPFLGVNHHRHTISYGKALLRNESATNFFWLFKILLQAMYEKHPRAIIIDQDLAMKKPIKEVFPNTFHRCCQWHVMRKAREHFGVLYGQRKGFHEELGVVINRSLTIPDFEKGWEAMVEKFKLHDNEHIKVMYTSRKQWVPAYFRDTFFANMSTTQRSESMNALFKLW